MQAKNIEEPLLDLGFLMPGFVEEASSQDRGSSGLALSQDLPTLTSVPSQSANRGKGRPKGQKNNKNKEKKTRNILAEENRKHGHWSTQENKRYHWFLEIYNNHFICKEMRRLDKIFKTMAVFIGSREAEQCRSHHQKMQKKYHSFSNIILFLRKSHYGFEDEKLVEDDIEANGVQKVGSLISMKQLKNFEIYKEVPPTPSLPEQAKIDSDMEEPMKEQLFQQQYLDFMGEDYQYRLELDNLLL